MTNHEHSWIYNALALPLSSPRQSLFRHYNHHSTPRSSSSLILIVISTCSLLLASRGVAAEPSSIERASFLSKRIIRTAPDWNASRIRRRKTTIPSSACFIQPLSKQTSLTTITITQPRHNNKLTSNTALHLKFKTFDEMLLHHHSAPILIDFYAPWCGPCKMMKGELGKIRERLDELVPPSQDEDEEEDCEVSDDVEAASAAGIDGADPNANNANVYKAGVKKEKKTAKPSRRSGGIPVYHVDTNKFPQVGAKNDIHGLPTLVLFYEGEEVWRNEGIILGDDIVDVLVGLKEGGWKKAVTTTTTK